jgi:hypothetical protein
VVHCTEFLPKSDNYNRAVAYASAGSEFVKIVEADNYLWSECLERMVNVASADPEIGIVGSYYAWGNRLAGNGIPVQQVVLSGSEVRRYHLLTNGYYLGVPTSVLFRAKALSEVAPCFRPDVFFDDIELCFRVLAKWKFGFVHQVLAFVRDDNDGVFNRIRDFDFEPAYRYVLAVQFGADVLEPDELSRVRKQRKQSYLLRLAHAAVTRRSQQFWEFHRNAFRLVSEDLTFFTLAGPVARTLIDMLLIPKSTIGVLLRLRRRLK